MVTRLSSIATAAIIIASVASVSSPGPQTPADTVAWTIVDTVTVKPSENGCCNDIIAHHLRVQTASGWRILPLLHLQPAQLPDRSLLLRVVNRDQSIVFRRYSLSGRPLSLVPRPPGYDSSYSWPEFFSPRQLLAYTIPLRSAGTRIEVRRWPRWELVTQSGAIERCDDAILDGQWTADGRYVVWHPPHCTDSTLAIDSLSVPPE